ncbi:MAG: aminotransferase class I/II-fold pyridoxal phosphate-dependent enzyme [Clostridia bacterium]|nr:aminotransferase class I/II-fold pyridoxal phosphate-dependent enzyme [Clostridia bacterium]
MSTFVSEKIKNLKPSGIRKFFDLVHEMKDAISLGVGEPDFVTPWSIRDAGIRSVQKGYTQYTGNRGLPELRENISRYLLERFGVSYSPDHVIVTVGASEGIDLALRATLSDGDEVLVPDPCYVSYAPCVTLAGGMPVNISCNAQNGFIVTPEELERKITPKTKAIILAYPNNPTGGIMTEEQLKAILPIIEKHDLLVISDEIYAELTYGTKHVSVAALPNMKERTVLIGGFSKAFAMTGWRIGFVCAPPDVDEGMFKIHQYGIMCAPTMGQYAANYALKEGLEDGFSVVEEMHDEYNRRRRFVVKSFNDMGLTCIEPKGAFYVFPSVESTGLSGEEFAERLLMSKRVAVVPGSAFGECGKNHIRCSYATSMAQLTEAMARIASFVEDLRK